MTGCPAWYDLENIWNSKNIDYQDKWSNEKKKIIISDAAFSYNKQNMINLIIYVRERFPNADIKVLFHRGLKKEMISDIDSEFQRNYNITIEDISGDCEKFKYYDDCDFHIGFRVHAHIYNLSRGNISILLNEDARGIGVNNALGVRNIDLKEYSRFAKNVDEYLIYKLDNYFDYLDQTLSSQYISVSQRIETYYDVMKNHIMSITEL